MHSFCHKGTSMASSPCNKVSVSACRKLKAHTLATETISSSKITSHKPINVREVHSVHVHEFYLATEVSCHVSSTRWQHVRDILGKPNPNPLCVIPTPPPHFPAIAQSPTSDVPQPSCRGSSKRSFSLKRPDPPTAGCPMISGALKRQASAVKLDSGEQEDNPI